MTSLKLAAARYRLGLETGGSLRDLGESLLSQDGMDAAVKLAVVDDLAMSEVGPIFERVCRELKQPIPALDEAIDIASAAMLRDIADDSVAPKAGLRRLMGVIDSAACQDGPTGSRYGVVESHDLQSLIGAYWGYDELQTRPDELSIDGKYGEEAIALHDRNVKTLASEWLNKHATDLSGTVDGLPTHNKVEEIHKVEEALLGPTEIFVSLLDEQVDVRRPVQAQHVHGAVYKIIDQPYDHKVETWQFEPGDEVVCELIDSDEGRILAAIRRVDQ